MLSYTSSAPHIVGREALLNYAVEDFIHEVTRQKPWRRARYETLLKSLNEHLDTRLGQTAPVMALDAARAETWLLTLPAAQRPLAEDALNDFADYLVTWNWVKVHPLRRVQTA